jgi:SPP1 gp7 family putative phage head morphogenesis protein
LLPRSGRTGVVGRPEPAEVLGAYASVQRAADADILRVLRDAYRDTNRDLQMLVRSRTPGSAIRRDQLRAVKQQILDSQSQVFARLGRVIEARRTQAAARAIRVAGRYDEALFAAHGRGPEAAALTRGLEATETRTIDAVIARMTGSSVPLSARVYRARTFADGALERRINSGLARGLSAQEMARELRDFVNPNTPGGQRYAALRLARTEINNAFHAMSIRAAQLKPWITKMQWHNSDSHPRPDECDALNGRLFPVDEVPRKPHPQDMCYVTPVVDVTEGDDDAFLDSLVGGDFDSFLNDVAARHGVEPPALQVAAPAPPAPPAPVPSAFETRIAAAARGRAAMQAVRTGLPRGGSLTHAQRRALRLYESAEFVAINGFLRRDEAPQNTADRRFARLVGDIDAAMRPIATDVETWRGLGRANRLFGEALSGDLEGFEWDEQAFSSTSTNEKMATDFALDGRTGVGEVVMRVLVPWGTRATVVSEGHNSQDEILVQRGLKWRVVKDHGVHPKGYRLIDVEVISG